MKNTKDQSTPKEITITNDGVKKYLAAFGNVCPVSGCGGSVQGTGASEFVDGDEIAVARECLKCGATWDDFYALADISKVTLKG